MKFIYFLENTLLGKVKQKKGCPKSQVIDHLAVPLIINIFVG